MSECCQVLEHTATKIGQEGDHWAISCLLSPTAQDKGERDIYETNNRNKLENTLRARSSGGSARKVTNASVEFCPLQDNLSLTGTNSTGGRDMETASQNSKDGKPCHLLSVFKSTFKEDQTRSARKKKVSLKITRQQGGGNVYVDDDVLSPNRRGHIFQV